MERYFAYFLSLALVAAQFYLPTAVAAEFKRQVAGEKRTLGSRTEGKKVEVKRQATPSAKERMKPRSSATRRSAASRRATVAPEIERYQPPAVEIRGRQQRTVVPVQRTSPATVGRSGGIRYRAATTSTVVESRLPTRGSKTPSRRAEAPAPGVAPQVTDEPLVIAESGDDPWSGGELPTTERPEIKVNGNFIVSYLEILEYAGLGDATKPITATSVTQAVKRLYATDYFSDVNIYKQGNALIIEVKENPMINRIAFEGNEKIKDGTLENEVGIRQRQIYSRDAVLAATKRILSIYRRSGRFSAEVEPKIIKLSNNRIDLVFEINENSLTKVANINFLGNKRFSNSDLRDVLLTREKRWYRLFSSSDVYDPDRISYDGELLRRFYLKNGYADFNLVSAVSELSPDKLNFYITFTVEEGERYKVGEVKVDSKIEDVPPALFESVLLTESGEWYSAEDLEASMDAIKNEFADLGYAFVEVSPQIRRNVENHELDITYVMEKAKKVFVAKININGNYHTLDQVVLRELLLREGDPFDISRVRRSRRNLEMLGIFQNVEIRTVQTQNPERVVLDVNIQEMPTGELSLGTGYSTSDGALGNIRLRERNFLGRGQDVSIGASVSQRNTTFDVGSTFPYIFDRHLTGNGRAYHTKSDFKKESGYEETRSGVTVGIGYELARNLYHNVSYDGFFSKLKISIKNPSTYLKEQVGNNFHSIIGNSLRYDTRDSYYNPSEGMVLSTTASWSGLGGDVDYLSLTTIDTIYYTLVPLWTSSLTMRAGYISGLGQNVRIGDHFYLGDKSFRGFQVSGLGPRDKDLSALGGTKYYVGQLEQQFPLGLPPELEINGRIFFDVGTVYGNDLKDTKKGDINDDSSLRYSTGIGIAWRSPFGGIRVYYAKVLKKQAYDKTENIIFSFGSSF